MILTTKNTKNKIVKVKDAMGRYIPHAFYYNTKTNKTGVYIYATTQNNKKSVATANKNGVGYVVKAYLVIPGSYAEINGKKVG